MAASLAVGRLAGFAGIVAFTTTGVAPLRALSRTVRRNWYGVPGMPRKRTPPSRFPVDGWSIDWTSQGRNPADPSLTSMSTSLTPDRASLPDQCRSRAVELDALTRRPEDGGSTSYRYR